MKTTSHIEQLSNTECFAVFVYDDGKELQLIHDRFVGIDCYADACAWLRQCRRPIPTEYLQADANRRVEQRGAIDTNTKGEGP